MSWGPWREGGQWSSFNDFCEEIKMSCHPFPSLLCIILLTLLTLFITPFIFIWIPFSDNILQNRIQIVLNMFYHMLAIITERTALFPLLQKLSSQVQRHTSVVLATLEAERIAWIQGCEDQPEQQSKTSSQKK